MKKYQEIIQCLLRLNPEPTDEQFHHLARAINVDIEELEAVAYRMLGRHINKVKAGLPPLSIDDMALSGLLVESQTPDSSLMLNDGTVDTKEIELLQEALSRDGECNPYDQTGLINDGAIIPRFPLSHRVQLVSKTKVNSAIVDNPAGIDRVQNLLAKAGIKTKLHDPCHLSFRTRTMKDDIQTILATLKDYRIRVNNSSVLDKSSFAIKGRDGLVIQRLGDHLRIFFSK